MTEDKPIELQSPVPGLEFPEYTQRDCGHFCEACARRDDKITRLLGLLEQAKPIVNWVAGRPCAEHEPPYADVLLAQHVLAKIEKEKAK